jgi:hypothetical protein
MMDNVQNCDSYINIPSSQTFRSYVHTYILCRPVKGKKVQLSLCLVKHQAPDTSGRVKETGQRSQYKLLTGRLRNRGSIIDSDKKCLSSLQT